MPGLRRLLERASRDRTIRRKIVVGSQRVDVIVSPDSQLKYLLPGTGAFDRDLVALAERLVDARSVVWDIGANSGIFSFAAACLAREGTVLALEADGWLATILRRAADLPSNRAKDIRILSAAVSDRAGIARFSIAARGRASNSLAEVGSGPQSGGVREVQLVATVTLDQLLAVSPPPDLVKIDIEGAELLALRGADRVLGEVRPRFYIEVNETTASDVFDIFAAHGYMPSDLDGSPLAAGGYANVLFTPA